MSAPHLLYFADPMCSWCWGFSPTVTAIEARFGAALPIRLVLGGLRPGVTNPMRERDRDVTRSHWEHVRDASGQPFDFAFFARENFVYDTEPAARATVTVRSLWPQHVWRYFKAVQHAFYAEGRNVTEPGVLADIAEALDLPRAEFGAAFASQKMHDATLQDFQQSQAWGIRGFPTLVAEHGDHLHLVGSGFMPIATLRERLSAVATAHDHSH